MENQADERTVKHTITAVPDTHPVHKRLLPGPAKALVLMTGVFLPVYAGAFGVSVGAVDSVQEDAGTLRVSVSEPTFSYKTICTEALSETNPSIDPSSVELDSLIMEFSVIDAPGDSATRGEDYNVSDVVVVEFGSSRSSDSFNIGIVDDTSPEDSETFTIQLTDPIGVARCITGNNEIIEVDLGPGDIEVRNAPVVEIIDNDLTETPENAVTISASDADASETGPDPGEFTIALGAVTQQTLSVGYQIGGSAIAGEDYQTLSGSATILAGQQSVTVTVTPIEDDIAEDNETVVLTLVAGSGYTLGSPVSATVTITDDPPTGPSLQDFTTTPNQQIIANTIETLCLAGAGDAAFARDCNALLIAATANDAGLNEALAQLTPDALSTPLDASQTSIRTQLTTIRQRLSLLRSGATTAGLDVDGLKLSYSDTILSGRQLRSAVNGTGGGSAGEDSGSIGDFGRLGVFISGNADFGDRDRSTNQEGFDFQTYGLTAGADYRFSDRLILGGAVSLASTDTDIDASRGDLETDGYTLTLYGTYAYLDNAYVDGSLSYSWYDYDQTRRVGYTLTTTSVDQTFSADYEGDQFAIDISTGYDFNSGGLQFGPVARLSYVDVEVDGYSETAASAAAGSGFAVAIDEQNAESLTLSVGGRVSYALSQSWGILIPQAQLDWVHEFKDDSGFISGRFVAADDTADNAFRLSTDATDANYFSLGVGVSAQFTGGMAGFVEYRTVLGYDNLDQSTVNAGFRWEF